MLNVKNAMNVPAIMLPSPAAFGDLFNNKIRYNFRQVKRLRKVNRIVNVDQNDLRGKARMVFGLYDLDVIFSNGVEMRVYICVTSFTTERKADHEWFRHMLDLRASNTQTV